MAVQTAVPVLDLTSGRAKDVCGRGGDRGLGANVRLQPDGTDSLGWGYFVANAHKRFRAISLQLCGGGAGPPDRPLALAALRIALLSGHVRHWIPLVPGPPKKIPTQTSQFTWAVVVLGPEGFQRNSSSPRPLQPAFRPPRGDWAGRSVSGLGRSVGLLKNPCIPGQGFRSGPVWNWTARPVEFIHEQRG